jgi:hypothetical protein
MLRGTSPLKSPRTFFAAPITLLALLLKNPVERMSPASSSWLTFAKSAMVGYFAKSPGVTSFHPLVRTLRREDCRHQ